jgi:hypothetical protein
MLESVMQQHQHSFVLSPNPGRQGLLQISTPTEQEGAATGDWIRDASVRPSPA